MREKNDNSESNFQNDKCRTNLKFKYHLPPSSGILQRFPLTTTDSLPVLSVYPEHRRYYCHPPTHRVHDPRWQRRAPRKRCKKYNRLGVRSRYRICACISKCAFMHVCVCVRVHLDVYECMCVCVEW